MGTEGSFLASLDAEQEGALTSRGRRRRFPRGATIFLEGEPSEHVVLLLRGKVKVAYLTDEGREVVLAVREPGDLIGELSAIDAEPRSASATALEPVEAILVTADDFREFLRAHADAALLVLRLLSRRLREADRKRVEFGTSDTLGRVAACLLELSQRFGADDAAGRQISMPLTQEEVAAWVGASRKAVTNALQQMRARGWIETGRRRIVLHDLDALRRRAT